MDNTEALNRGFSQVSARTSFLWVTSEAVNQRARKRKIRESGNNNAERTLDELAGWKLTPGAVSSVESGVGFQPADQQFAAESRQAGSLPHDFGPPNED